MAGTSCGKTSRTSAAKLRAIAPSQFFGAGGVLGVASSNVKNEHVVPQKTAAARLVFGLDGLVGVPGAGRLAHERKLGARLQPATVAAIAIEPYHGAEDVEGLPVGAPPDACGTERALGARFHIDRAPRALGRIFEPARLDGQLPLGVLQRAQRDREGASRQRHDE